MLVAMTFRTPEEAVALANNTDTGLPRASGRRTINLALDIAPKLKAGVVWVNSTNLFDAAAGFGGYAKAGFGREGGREGLLEYLDSRCDRQGGAACRSLAGGETLGALPRQSGRAHDAAPRIDRTAKLYIGGKQARPDGGYSLFRRRRRPGARRRGRRRQPQGHPQRGRGGGECRRGWGAATAHNRAQILYYIAENLAARAGEFAARLAR